MESGGETFYIKKETTAQSSNLESCVTTRTVDISGLRFQPSPRFFAREKGQVGKWSGEGEEENQDFCEDRGWSPLPSNLVAEFQDGGIPRSPDSIGFAPAVMVCITPWKKRATLFACHLHAICI